jgi:hypothetical protein
VVRHSTLRDTSGKSEVIKVNDGDDRQERRALQGEHQRG